MRRKGFVTKLRIGKLTFALYEQGKKEERAVTVKETIVAMEPLIVDAVVAEEEGATPLEARAALLEWMCQFAGKMPFDTAKIPVSILFPMLVKETIRLHREGKASPRRRRKRIHGLLA